MFTRFWNAECDFETMCVKKYAAAGLAGWLLRAAATASHC